jgi:hypothetical protein
MLFRIQPGGYGVKSLRHVSDGRAQGCEEESFIRLLSIDVYGRPDDGLVEGLRQKAKMLGSGTVRVHNLHAGLMA